MKYTTKQMTPAKEQQEQGNGNGYAYDTVVIRVIANGQTQEAELPAAMADQILKDVKGNVSARKICDKFVVTIRR